MHLFLRAAITKYHKLGGLNNRNLFFPVLQAGSPRWCHQGHFQMRPLFLACDGHLPSVSSQFLLLEGVERNRSQCLFFFL